MSFANETKLGPYEILWPLGAGGMGEVYLALDGKLYRQVAIKVLPKVMTREPERVARLGDRASSRCGPRRMLRAVRALRRECGMPSSCFHATLCLFTGTRKASLARIGFARLSAQRMSAKSRSMSRLCLCV